MSDSHSPTNQSRIYNGLPRPNYCPSSITSLRPDEVFVFGSNLQGNHAGGAAYFAWKNFGAVWGQGIGLQGKSYAIPTMQGGVETIQPFVDQFIAFAREHEELFFYVTRIGCGIARFGDADIAPLFKDAISLDNICLPEQFVKEIEKLTGSPGVPEEFLTMMHGQIRTLIDLLKELNKQDPVKDSADAYQRLTELIERNVRFGDTFAFMALRTIWCLMSEHEQKGDKVDIGQLEKEMFSFHDGNEYLHGNGIVQVLYNYSARKMIKYIQILNEFRRYSDYLTIREDLQTIPVSHCSSNDPHYYYSFSQNTLREISDLLAAEWDHITKNGRLDNDLLEQVASERFGDPAEEPESPSCTDIRFEMRFAHVILDDDANYYRLGNLYLPVSDYSLPVYTRDGVKLHFDSQEEKESYIRSAGRSC